jgi:(2R)-ethylmalonyl-CoA mutase
MDQLFDQIPLDQMNTSMTINATAAWLLSLYIGLAQRRGIDPKKLSGTTQNDIIKEYLSRGTYIYPPGPSMRLIADTINYTVKHVPKWNPTNICSYHLQEAGATPVQELAYALCTAMAVLDRVKASGEIEPEEFPQVVERISFFVNAGIRFVEECCKLRAFGEMWDELALTRYKVEDPKLRRFRYGVQVNSLGLTEPQPENNVQRIVLEMLAVVLSKGARARAIQLPGLERGDGLAAPLGSAMGTADAAGGGLRNRSARVRGHSRWLAGHRRQGQGTDRGCAKGDRERRSAGRDHCRDRIGLHQAELVGSHMNRLRAIESGDLKIIGVNCFQETAESPLTWAATGPS